MKEEKEKEGRQRKGVGYVGGGEKTKRKKKKKKRRRSNVSRWCEGKNNIKNKKLQLRNAIRIFS